MPSLVPSLTPVEEGRFPETPEGWPVYRFQTQKWERIVTTNQKHLSYWKSRAASSGLWKDGPLIYSLFFGGAAAVTLNHSVRLLAAPPKNKANQMARGSLNRPPLRGNP